MFRKITSLATLPDYVLLVGFSSGEFKQFDLKSLMNKYPPFAAIKNVNGLYEQAKIDAGGYGLSGTTTSIFPPKVFTKKASPAPPLTTSKNTGRIFCPHSSAPDRTRDFPKNSSKFFPESRSRA